MRRISPLVAAVAGVAALVAGVLTDHGSAFAIGVLLIAAAAALMVVQQLFKSQSRAAQWAQADGAAFGGLAELPVGAALAAGVLHSQRPGLARGLSMIFGGRLLGRIAISADDLVFELPDEGRRIGLEPRMTVRWQDVVSADIKADDSQRDAAVLRLTLRPNKDLRILVYGYRELTAAMSDLRLPLSH